MWASEAAPVSLVQIVLDTGDEQQNKNLICDFLRLLEGGEATPSTVGPALGQLIKGHPTPDVLARLVSLLGNNKSLARAAAAPAVAKIGKAAATNEVITNLVTLTSDAETFVRTSAAEALGELGKLAINQDPLPHLLRLLRDQEVWVRSAAATALGQLGRATDQVIAELLALLSDYRAAGFAAEALGRLGEGAATAQVMGRLEEIVFDSNVDLPVYRPAARALANLAGYLPVHPQEPPMSILHWIKRFEILAGRTDGEMTGVGYAGLRDLVAKAGTAATRASELESH